MSLATRPALALSRAGYPRSCIKPRKFYPSLKILRSTRAGKLLIDVRLLPVGPFFLFAAIYSLFFLFNNEGSSRFSGTSRRQASGHTALNDFGRGNGRYVKPTASKPGAVVEIKGQRYESAGTIVPVGSYRPFSDRRNGWQNAVRNATMRVWDAYEKHAFGYDEMRPISGSGRQVFGGGVGLTIVDSLSTLYIVGESNGRYWRARNWVRDKLEFENVGTVSFFETTIRLLGGLLSIYHLSGDHMYITKAEDLGSRLAHAFNTTSHYPCNSFSLRSKVCTPHAQDVAYLAEVGTNQLEFRALSHHSRSLFLESARALSENVIFGLQHIKSVPRTEGQLLKAPHNVLLPQSISTRRNVFSSRRITFGGPGDSYFEYLIKMWIQGGKRERHYWETFAQVVDSVIEHSLTTSSDGLTILADLVIDIDGKAERQNSMQHLACFFPGSIILGLEGLGNEEVERRTKWVDAAKNITRTCYEMYRQSPTGLSGEEAHPGFGKPRSEGSSLTTGDYNIRPEAIEAMFYLYRYTGDEMYRTWGWTIFQAMEAQSQTSLGAYAMISQSGRKLDNNMPSFAIAETLKYLYLLFGDSDDIPLSKYVFNTEAHPLLITPGLASPELSKET